MPLCAVSATNSSTAAAAAKNDQDGFIIFIMSSIDFVSALLVASFEENPRGAGKFFQNPKLLSRRFPLDAKP